MQLLQNGSVVNNTANSTTLGTLNSVTPGSGTTGDFTATPSTAYTINQLGSSGANLGQYNSSLACTNATTGSTTVLPTSLTQPFTPQAGDTITCTVTNKAKPATLVVRQLVQSPVPVNLLPPFDFAYQGDNGWTLQHVSNSSLNTFQSSAVATLTGTNVATTLFTTLPEPRYFVSGFSCVDSNAAVTGNPAGTLVSVKTTSVTIPAANVRAASALRCTMLLGHFTP